MKTEFEIKTQFEELKISAGVDPVGASIKISELAIELLLDIRLLSQLLVSGLIRQGGKGE